MAVYLSFDHDRDLMRAKQVLSTRQITAEPLLEPGEWEQLQSQGDQAVQRWIDRRMAGTTAVVVLVGAATADCRWVQYEIRRAWERQIPLAGVLVDKLAPSGDQDRVGANPFNRVRTRAGGSVGDFVIPHPPSGTTNDEAYVSLQANLKDWVSAAVKRR